MATEKNIQIKTHNGTDWDSLFPKTKAVVTMLNDGSTVQSKVDSILTDLGKKVEQSNIDSAVASLVNSSPETLDTLRELASALGNDPNFATTITNSLGNKVDKIAGKGLSTNDYTTADKTEVGKVANKVDKIAGKGLSTNDYTTADKTEVGKVANKVDKVAGKVLSTNDFTNVLKTKLDSLVGITVSTSANAPTSGLWFETI